MRVVFITVVYFAISCYYPNKAYTHSSTGYHRRKSLENVYSSYFEKSANKEAKWNGRWFPSKPEDKTNAHDYRYKINMLNISGNCDDGKTNLEVDWNSSPINYTCFYFAGYYKLNVSVPPIIRHEHIPPAYHAYHMCMDRKIEYDRVLPTFGTHRPVWAKYGEYKFLPKQRWLHNAEHGAVIMLYHPCAHPSLVSQLRSIVTSCLYRHIITPYNLLPEDRPLALLTWGHYMLMNFVSQKLAVQFIKEHALNGLEDLNSDGRYDYFLEQVAEPVVNYEDTSLCPDLNGNNDNRYNLLDGRQ